LCAGCTAAKAEPESRSPTRCRSAPGSHILAHMRLWLLAVTTIVLAGCASSPHPETPNVRIAIGGRAALDFIPVYLAASLGFFREEGLDVTFQDLAGSAKAIQSLLGGSSDVVAGGYDAAVEMTIKGQPIQAIATLERWPPLVVVATRRSGRDLRTLRDLKGTLVGVSSPGSSTHRFINYVLRKNGMSLSDISASRCCCGGSARNGTAGQKSESDDAGGLPDSGGRTADTWNCQSSVYSAHDSDTMDTRQSGNDRQARTSYAPSASLDPHAFSRGRM
jgi:hypothetical protein